ncbi:hypothetical protein Patl1_14618 [Pistacia atlantica]|uniref:Uncharacterized protein n=1 Tax=Pistacia atlantica TaxID=434234 RepID=A0ACC1AVH7_9ROSI|nr:hypothetical protein Patl1_14618 [Pistacia atlantica]
MARFRLSLDQINAFKAKLKNEHGTMYSTFVILAAHVWCCVCKARGLSMNQLTKLYIPIEGRLRLNPPLPLGHLGNVVFTATSIALAGDIQSKPLIYTVKIIHETLKRMNDEYLRSTLAYVEQHYNDLTAIKQRVPRSSSCPNLRIGYYLRPLLRFQETLQHDHDQTTLKQGAPTCKSPNLRILSWLRMPVYGFKFCKIYGGFKKPALEDPVKTNKIPRQIPKQPWYMTPVFSILIGGILPFGAIFIEVFFILTSVWLHQFYYIFGSSAFYLFLYAAFYFFAKLDITKPISGILYFGYMLIVSYAFFLLTGTIGFYAADLLISQD